MFYGPRPSPGRQRSARPRQRAVDHVHGIADAIDRDKGAEARPLLLAEQHLVEHVEPVERHAGPAVLAFLVLVEEWLTTADRVDHILDVSRRRSRRQARQCIAQILQGGALALAWLAELFGRRHE